MQRREFLGALAGTAMFGTLGAQAATRKAKVVVVGGG